MDVAFSNQCSHKHSNVLTYITVLFHCTWHTLATFHPKNTKQLSKRTAPWQAQDDLSDPAVPFMLNYKWIRTSRQVTRSPNEKVADCLLLWCCSDNMYKSQLKTMHAHYMHREVRITNNEHRIVDYSQPLAIQQNNCILRTFPLPIKLCNPSVNSSCTYMYSESCASL